jgi:protein O-mannosyl-transferase
MSRHPPLRPAAAPPRPAWQRIVLQLAVLAAVVLAAYAPILSAGYVWDDDAYVADNANLRDGAGLARIWLEPRSSPQYYPLVFTSFWIERRVGMDGPGLSHAVNVCLQLANAALLWGMLRRLRVPGAYAAALVFAVHPVHVESVAWITERKNVLSGAWYLVSAWAYLEWAGISGPDAAQPEAEGGTQADNGRPRWMYAVSVCAFVAALLSKTVTATLPAVLLLAVWWRRGRVRAGDVGPLLPFFALGAALAGLTAWLEVHHVGASGVEWSGSAAERALLAGRIVWFYVRSLAWPHPLMFVYPRWTISASDVWAWMSLLSAVAVLLALARWRAAIGRAPLAAALAFLVTLAPVLGFFNVYPMRFSFVADHFQYLASVFVIAGAAAAGAALCRRWNRYGRQAAAALTVLVVAALAATARAETAKFTSLESLWLDTLAKNPGAYLARNNLGSLRMSQGRYDDARALFAEVTQQRPDFAVAHNNLGTALFREGKIEAALDAHRRAVELDPSYAEARNNLGVDLANLGRLQEAVEAYRAALRLNPDYAMAHYNLGNVLVRQNRLDEAEPHYRDAIRLGPDLALPRFYLGLNLLAAGRAEEAAPLLREAFGLKPDFAPGYYQVGTVRLQRGELDEAASAFQQAIARKPDYAEAYNNLGVTRMKQNDLDAARRCFDEAIRLAPGYAMARTNRALVLEKLAGGK